MPPQKSQIPADSQVFFKPVRPRGPRRPSMPEQFPDQFSVKANIWTPQGSKIEMFGPISDVAGELILGAFCHQAPSPALLKAMKALAKRLLPETKKTPVRAAKTAQKPAKTPPKRRR